MITSRFNPIIRIDEVLPGQIFLRRPSPETNMALVLKGRRRPNVVLKAGGQSMWDLLMWRHYQYAYWIDMEDHSFLIDYRLPSKDIGLDFEASIYIAYKVNNPSEVVRLNITDARAEIEETVKSLMREKSRQYSLLDASKAEQEIDQAINQELQYSVIKVKRCFVALKVEEEVREHTRKRYAAARNYIHSMKSANYTKEINKQDAEIGQHMTTFYNNLSQPGYAHFLLLHPSSNHDQIELVLTVLNQQRQLEREHWLKMLEMLNKSGALEPSDWAILRKTVIERLTEAAQTDTTNANAPALNTKKRQGAGGIGT